MIEEYGKTFFEKAEMVEIVVPDNTWLVRAATDVVEMSQAYASDGFVFLANNDEVNALASFAYGNGWLDTGVKAGLLASISTGVPPLGCTQDIPENLSDHLKEKTFRYERMLSSALASVCINSEPELPLYPAGEELCRITRLHYTEGTSEIQRDNLADGLALLSYAYGWIDAGVRTGILKVVRNPELFTV
ncbi:DUF357 domain-containing protein [Methanogenium sp. MK-MG]|uniref:DUF357 domain-containing protein n=1 Tax=Methanogenium sp. MK-MG TaxID=2599926 RepID=UPI0013EAD787|nr:DUF357 domain-containing protein [Methanogenium sp. MK-MG]KAF1078000.1 hypothetical protein MKMG_01108 [Methanogenium sp. MK-MG]